MFFREHEATGTDRRNKNKHRMDKRRTEGNRISHLEVAFCSDYPTSQF